MHTALLLAESPSMHCAAGVPGPGVGPGLGGGCLVLRDAWSWGGYLLWGVSVAGWGVPTSGPGGVSSPRGGEPASGPGGACLRPSPCEQNHRHV